VTDPILVIVGLFAVVLVFVAVMGLRK